MVTIVNLRRIEQLEEKTGGASFVARLSDAELDARLLTYATGENPKHHLPVQDSGEVLPSDDELYAMMVKDVNRIALSCSKRPDHFDDVLDALHELGAPNADAMLVEAVRESFGDA